MLNFHVLVTIFYFVYLLWKIESDSWFWIVVAFLSCVLLGNYHRNWRCWLRCSLAKNGILLILFFCLSNINSYVVVVGLGVVVVVGFSVSIFLTTGGKYVGGGGAAVVVVGLSI